MQTELSAKVEAFDGMPADKYHAHPALGSTSLKTLASPGGPAKWKHEQENPTGYKKEFAFGTAAHSIILENDSSKIHIMETKNKDGDPVKDFRMKDAQDERDEAVEAGLEPLLQREYDEIILIRDQIMAHPLAANALTGHIAERSIFWEQYGIPVKCRPDALREGQLIADLKTTADANPGGFDRTAYNLGYYISAAHYIEGVYQLTEQRLPFVFINVEKKAPYLVSITELSEDALEYGRYMIDRALRIYAECLEADKWPGYPAFTDQIDLPLWATRELEDLLDGDDNQ